MAEIVGSFKHLNSSNEVDTLIIPKESVQGLSDLENKVNTAQGTASAAQTAATKAQGTADSIHHYSNIMDLLNHLESVECSPYEEKHKLYLKSNNNGECSVDLENFQFNLILPGPYDLAARSAPDKVLMKIVVTYTLRNDGTLTVITVPSVWRTVDVVTADVLTATKDILLQVTYAAGETSHTFVIGSAFSTDATDINIRYFFRHI